VTLILNAVKESEPPIAEAKQKALTQTLRPCLPLLVVAVAVLRLLVLVLQLGSKNGARYGSNNAVTAHLVASEVASCTAT